MLQTVMEIKEDLGGLTSDVRSVKESLDHNEHVQKRVNDDIRKMESTVAMIPGYIQSAKDMEYRLDIRMGKIENDVKAMRETEIPQLKDQLVVQRWLSSKRNKISALIGVGLLGAAGNAAAGLIKDNVRVTIMPQEAHPQVHTVNDPIDTMSRFVPPLSDAVDLDADVTPR
jgi:hypothetical protein